MGALQSPSMSTTFHDLARHLGVAGQYFSVRVCTLRPTQPRPIDSLTSLVLCSFPLAESGSRSRTSLQPLFERGLTCDPPPPSSARSPSCRWVCSTVMSFVPTFSLTCTVRPAKDWCAATCRQKRKAVSVTFGSAGGGFFLFCFRGGTT